MKTIIGAMALTASLLASETILAADVAQSAYARKDYSRSAELFRRQAFEGRPVAQTFLGYQYQMGWGVPKSFKEASFWFARAADQGEPTAQFFLGMLIDRGQGVPEDPVEAAKWLDLAAAHAPRDRLDYWTGMRDAVSSKLTLDELAEARRRAVVWRPVFER